MIPCGGTIVDLDLAPDTISVSDQLTRSMSAHEIKRLQGRHAWLAICRPTETLSATATDFNNQNSA